MVRFKDRGGRDMVLAMTHEEVVADLLRDVVKSYRQLPAIVYHFQTKFRDEPRARGGLIRVREFVMKDSYTLDPDEAGAGPSRYQAHYGAYEKIFARLGLETVVVGADVGIMGGSLAHEFMVLNEPARTRSSCARRATTPPTSRSRAVAKPEPPAEEAAPDRGGGDPRDADRSRPWPRSWGSATDRTAKAIFFVTGDGRLVTAIVRGDYEVNETKLTQRGQGDRRLRPGTRRGDRGRRHGARLRLAHRRPRPRWSSSTTWRPARRTWWPARTSTATTC